MLRRTIVTLPILAGMSGMFHAAAASIGQVRPRVAAGADREGKARAIGLSETTYKVLTEDSAGDLFVVEQMNRRRGGPSRHMHLHEDEFFFCLDGEYVVEVEDQRAVLHPGDCILAPRGIPHAWAFSGDTVGRLLISFAPAGKMEAFFAAREGRGIQPGQYARSEADAAMLREFGMELVGPPIPLDTL